MVPALIVLGGIAYSTIRALWTHQKPQPVTAPDITSDELADGGPVAVKPAQNVLSQMPEEQRIDHYMGMVGWAAIASVATWFFPPAGLAAAALLTYTAIPIFEGAATTVLIERKPRANQVDALIVAITLLGGYYVLASICSTVYFYGYKLLYRTQARSKHRLENLFGKNPRHVWLYCDNVEVEVPFESLESGNVIVLRAGEFIPIDGTVVDGVATIDQRTLTGESHPVEKTVGDAVFASTTLAAGKLHVRVEKTGTQTTAASIQRILDDTADYTQSVEQEAIRFSDSLAVPTLIAGGAGAFIIGPSSAAALVGCNLSELNRIAGPMGILNYLDLTAAHGVLVKDGRSLELLQGIDTVVFDKTGTLTLDQPELGCIHQLGALSEQELLRIAATAEARQSHPIANAILSAAKAQGIQPVQLDDARYEIGYGLKVEFDGRIVHIGSIRFMHNEGIRIDDPARVETLQECCDELGFSLIYIACDHALVGALEMHSAIRPEARAVIAQLKSRGLDLYIVSGDHDEPTRRMAEQVGIPHYFANVLPDGKAKIIEDLRGNGKAICFVGDGINDAVALKTANVGISIHGASDAALDTAGIILMDRTLNQLGNLFELADELARNRKYCYYTTMVPGALGAVAVVSFGLGISSALVLYIISGSATIGTAMWPKFAHRDILKNSPSQRDAVAVLESEQA